MTTAHAFGNDPAKIERYRKYWAREEVPRPLIGFSQSGWFPLQSFQACRNWEANSLVTPDMVDPSQWLDDQERLILEGEQMDDDLIRGVNVSALAFPGLLAGILGCNFIVTPDSIYAEPLDLDWKTALPIEVNPENAWYRKYVEFLDALSERSKGRYPVSHAAELGPTDLHAVIRGHTQSLLDLLDHPEQSRALLHKLGLFFIDWFKMQWERLPRWRNGWFDAQYQLWCPGPVIRLQEDALAGYSPKLYRDLIQPVDRMIAENFSHCFMHTHSTSMFLLEHLLDIEEIKLIQVNYEPYSVPLEQMIPCFQRIQASGRPLLIRGTFEPNEIRLVMDAVEPKGLYLHLMVQDMFEMETLRPLVGM